MITYISEKIKGVLHVEYEYLLAVAAILNALLLAACVIFFLFYRKNSLEKTRNENALLNQLNKKTEFFSNMAHELKTPLSVIFGAVQLMEMKKPGQTEEYNSFIKNLRIIKCNCYRMSRLTNNLLEMTKIEAGYLKLKQVNCDLSLLIEEIIQSVLPYAVQKQLNLHYDNPSEAIFTAVDIEKMERIMLNLLSNAIKFTKSGGFINVTCYTIHERVFISVKDSGVGIPAENQGGIFARFKQVGNYPSVEEQGSGIGLSLVKSFVDLHHGGIRINSEQNQGCEFIIDIPLRLVNNEAGNANSEDCNIRLAEAVTTEFSTLNSIAL